MGALGWLPNLKFRGGGLITVSVSGTGMLFYRVGVGDVMGIGMTMSENLMGAKSDTADTLGVGLGYVQTGKQGP